MRKILFHLQEVMTTHLPFSQEARRPESPFRMALFILSLQQAPIQLSIRETQPKQLPYSPALRKTQTKNKIYNLLCN
jgi:hypothetical protein